MSSSLTASFNILNRRPLFFESMLERIWLRKLRVSASVVTKFSVLYPSMQSASWWLTTPYQLRKSFRVIKCVYKFKVAVGSLNLTGHAPPVWPMKVRINYVSNDSKTWINSHKLQNGHYFAWESKYLLSDYMSEAIHTDTPHFFTIYILPSACLSICFSTETKTRKWFQASAAM